MAGEQAQENNRYFTTTYPYTASYCVGYTHQFYLVTTFHNDTSLGIVQKDGTTYNVDLPEFGTFLQVTEDPNDHLADGTLITSNKPINVVSGNLCLANFVDIFDVGTYISNMPAVNSLGFEYVVPKIIHQDTSPPGYSVSVVATEDNTSVEIGGEIEILDQSKSVTFEYPLTDTSMFVNCSKPCLVVQYSKCMYISSTTRAGMFMQAVLSENELVTSSYFTTLEVYPLSYISLVVKGESPGDDLYLNGTSLGYLNWAASNGYSTAEMAIPLGVYALESVNGRPFALYVYLHLNYYTGGAGYALLSMESSSVTSASTTLTTSASTTTVTATPSPSVNASLPQHTARVNGTAFTEDGEDMSPACIMVNTLSHTSNLTNPQQ